MKAVAASAVRLGYVASVRGGDSVVDRVEGAGIPIYGAGELLGFTNAANASAGDVVVGRVGSVGSLRLLSSEAWATDNTLVVSLDLTRVEPRFAIHALREIPIAEITSGTAMPLVTGSKLLRQQIPLPALGEQRAIADYLDRETARIDMLIEEQQRLIDLLWERRDSMWAERLKQAQGLGHVVSVRRLIDSIADGPFGSSLTSAHYSDEGARVIRLGNIGVNEFKDGDAAFIPLDYADELDAHAVERGDVVVAGLGDDKMPLGRAAVVPALGRAIVKADCYRIRPNDRCTAAYLAWALSAPQTRSQIMLLARGSTRARLNTKVVQQVEIPLPDRRMQEALVGQSAVETAKVDSLIAEAVRFIELSQERRSALITAAVTGQIDVRAAA